MSWKKLAMKNTFSLDLRLIEELAERKNEPKWMRERRIRALQLYKEIPLPAWGEELKDINFEDINYYLKPITGEKRTWDEVPEKIKETFEKIGVPEAEREVLAGVKTQVDSEVVYGSLRKSLARKGVVFLSMEEGLKQYPDLVKQYWGTIVPVGDNKLAALNSAAWSGGSFVYIPANVEVELPLQAYFRINAEKM